MLSILNRYEPETAHAILAATALAQDERNRSRENVSRYSKEIEEVLQELRGLLRVPLNDESEETLRKINQALSKEITKAILGSTPLREVQDSLGKRGDLPIGGYKISFPKHFPDFKEPKAFIEKSIRAADQVKHIREDVTGDFEPRKGQTLITKLLPSSKKSKHWLVVDAVRSGSELNVGAAWRVFPEAVDVEGVADPQTLLKRFVDVYGLDVEIKGIARGKFLENVILPIGFPVKDQSYRIIHSNGRKFMAVETGSVLEFGTSGAQTVFAQPVIISFYAIDYAKYRSDYTRYI